MSAAYSFSSAVTPAVTIDVASDLLGPLTVPFDAVVQFPSGAPGYPEDRAFALVGADPEHHAYWLQSLHSPALAFLMVNPFACDGDRPAVLPAALESLAADEPGLLTMIRCPVPATVLE